MSFYGIVSFCDKEIMGGEAFWGVWRLEIGWRTGPLGDPLAGIINTEALQLNEFLDSMGKHRFEFMPVEEARLRVLGVGSARDKCDTLLITQQQE